jgi:hypothetical protein
VIVEAGATGDLAIAAKNSLSARRRSTGMNLLVLSRLRDFVKIN